MARVETAMWLLSLREDAVMDLIANGHLIAFDLRGPEARRALPAIWSRSLRCHAASSSSTSLARPKMSEILPDILPPGTRDLRFSEVMVALGIKPFHMHNLMEAGLLQPVPGTGNNINRSPVITRASVVEFLTRRRM